MKKNAGIFKNTKGCIYSAPDKEKPVQHSGQRKLTPAGSLFLCLCFWLVATSLPLPVSASENQPQIVLWAWQRAEDFSAIDPREFGIAYLACHVLLSEDQVQVHWRDQPLNVASGAHLIPVIRIDTDLRHRPSFSPAQSKQVAQITEAVARLPHTAELQIDFDALETERPFYRQLLQAIALKLPVATPISITALASWCLYDDWIKDLPVDETVPMMFSLGHDRQKIISYLGTHDFPVEGCCKSLGLSLEDPAVNQLMIPLVKQRKIPVRIYFFSRTAWNKDKIQAVRRLLRKP